QAAEIDSQPLEGHGHLARRRPRGVAGRTAARQGPSGPVAATRRLATDPAGAEDPGRPALAGPVGGDAVPVRAVLPDVPAPEGLDQRGGAPVGAEGAAVVAADGGGTVEFHACDSRLGGSGMQRSSCYVTGEVEVAAEVQ